MKTRWLYPGTLFLSLLVPICVAGSDFRVPPYLQNPSPDSMTLVWFSETGTPGRLIYREEGQTGETELTSDPVRAAALAYPAWENSTFFKGQAPVPPFRHRVRLENLMPGATYTYRVEQNESRFSAAFTTAPSADRPIRFAVYGDCETEPESTGKRVEWTDPTGTDPDRLYLLDQTVGYANNLEMIRTRHPNFVLIAGDLVESGGEQRDWDEFWRHNAGADGVRSLAGRIPLLAAPGNHDYYEGPRMGRYDQPGSERAIHRFLTYFEFPPNQAPDPEQEGRYYRLDYGPISLIALDVANGSPHSSDRDTNFFLLGEADAGGGHAPDFNPGSRQYTWLETQLQEAQLRSRFTFVVFHHPPYSVGPHGWPPGTGDEFDTQSGAPTRILTSLFMKYGVDAVFSGHDEMWERSQIEGTEIEPDGREVPHTVYFYDVGIGGDGLRGPQPGLENPYQKFLAHQDAPEIWKDGVLVDGGKHYGHLEVDVLPGKTGGWQAVLKPVYIFPLLAADGTYLGSERRVYDDIITLNRQAPTSVNSPVGEPVASHGLEIPYPNPFNSTVLLRYSLATESPVKVEIFDLKGQRVRSLVEDRRASGYHSVEWDARDKKGRPVSSGVYLVKFKAGAFLDTAKVTLAR